MPSLPVRFQAYLTWEYGVFIALIVLIEVQIARAFLAGIASARDDMHRTVPVSRWYFFDRLVRRRLVRRLPLWVALAAGVFAFHYYRFAQGWMFSIYEPLSYRVWFVAQYTVEIVWSVLLTVAVLYALAPRLREIWLLVPAAFLLSLGLEVLVFSPLMHTAIPMEWRFWQREVELALTEVQRAMGAGRPGGSIAPTRLPATATTSVVYDLLQLYYLAAVAAVAWAARWMARRSGDGWFNIRD